MGDIDTTPAKLPRSRGYWVYPSDGQIISLNDQRYASRCLEYAAAYHEADAWNDGEGYASRYECDHAKMMGYSSPIEIILLGTFPTLHDPQLGLQALEPGKAST
jgi:hypothetical protein